MRGRSEGEIIQLLKKGVLEVGFDLSKLHESNSPELAWTDALANAQQTDLVVILTGRADKTIECLNR